MPELIKKMEAFVCEFRQRKNIPFALSIAVEIQNYLEDCLQYKAGTPSMNAVFEALHHTKMLDVLKTFLEEPVFPNQHLGVIILAQVSITTNELIIKELLRRQLDHTAAKYLENASRAEDVDGIRNALWFLANLYAHTPEPLNPNEVEKLLPRVIDATEPFYKVPKIAAKFVQLICSIISNDRQAFARYCTKQVLEVTLAVQFESTSVDHQHDSLLLLSHLTRITPEEDEQPYAMMALYMISEGFISRFFKSLDAIRSTKDWPSLAMFWRVIYNFASLESSMEVERVRPS